MTALKALPSSVQVAVVGASQAGLATGFYLRSTGLSYVLLDAAATVGAAWSSRWDSLRLFTSAQFCSLPGLPFPGPAQRYPGKDEVADYLRHYAEHFKLPVLPGHRVTTVRREADGFTLSTDHGTCRAEQVVLAAGAFGVPMLPQPAAELDPSVSQWHASQYRNPAQIPGGMVVVVGAGNSGVQIARELSADRRVVLCRGRDSPLMPQLVLGRDVFWWMSVLGVMDLPVRPTAPDPLIGISPNQLAEAGLVRLSGRVVSAHGGELVTEDGERLRPDAVIWATGYRGDFSWLDPECLDPSGAPAQVEGICRVPGVYFVGKYRMRNRGSALLGFVGADARSIVALVAERAGVLTG
jgi:putative flavoprotein involved in K+ transport